ncbi:MAG TPA: hypothetical protein VGV10_05185 [Thermoleophilaceae bacterium]|nr:hypothetical protein [Thermoleophilaceae bacterium]
MADVTHLGQAGLQGWRAKAGDLAAPALAGRTPLSEDQARALVGVLFFALSVMYVAKTIGIVSRELRNR